MNGVREFVIMRQTGHKTVATLRRYIRSGEIFRENAVGQASESKRSPVLGKFHFPSIVERAPGTGSPAFFQNARLRVSAESVGMSDFCGAHDWHTLGKCWHENPIRLLLFCQETLISANQR